MNLLKLIESELNDKLVSSEIHRNELSIFVKAEDLVEVISKLKDADNIQMDFMSDLSAVDYLPETPRFEVVYHLKSIQFNHRVRVKVKLDEDQCEVGTISHIYKCADWYERECFDMYGIKFSNHPNLKRILMYDSFEGHPLRKDYPVDKQQPIIDLYEVEERYNYER